MSGEVPERLASFEASLAHICKAVDRAEISRNDTAERLARVEQQVAHIERMTPVVDEAFGPVILSLRAEQWVGPPAIGSFLVILGVYQARWPGALRAVLRFVGWVTVATTVFAFGIGGFWAESMQMIFVYSLTTPWFVVPMAALGWRDVKIAMEGGGRV